MTTVTTKNNQLTTNTSLSEKDEPEWFKSNGSYFMSVSKVDDKYMPTLRKNRNYIWGGGLYNDLARAKDAVVIAYHQDSKDLVDGSRQEIDIELLVNHPKNAEIYHADEYESLIAQIDVEEPWIERLEINTQGEIIHGNRRKKAVTIINDRALKEGNAKRFSALPIEVVHFDSELDELKRLLLHNQTRKKTNSVRTLEGLLLLEIEKELGKQRKSIAKKKERTEEEQALLDDNKGVRSTQKVATAVGYGSASTFENSTNVITAITEVREKDPQLADEWLKVHDQKSIKTASDVLKIPDELKKEVCERINSTQGRVNVARIASEIKAEKAKQKASQAIHNNGELSLKETISLLKALGDKPNDNWFTPEALVKLCLRVCDLDEFDVDMFADLGRRVPALRHITIEIDAFKTDCKEYQASPTNVVFGNILYSDQARCFTRIDQQISSGQITTGFWIAESGAMHSKVCQEVLDKHNMTVCFWRGSKEESADKDLKKSRISFVPGDYLLAFLKYGKNRKEDDNWIQDVPDNIVPEDLDDLRGKNDNNRFNSLIVFYGEDKEAFYNVFSEFGRISFSKKDLAIATTTNTASPEWKEGTTNVNGKSVFAADIATFMGRELAIISNEDPNLEDVYDIVVDGKVIFSTVEDSISFARAMALGYCLQQSSSPF